MNLVNLYVPSRSNSRDARKNTDATLELERNRTDDELLHRSAALGEDADELIKRARARAQAVLELSRRREDSSLTRAGASAEAKDAVNRERDLEDATIRAEHATSDATLQLEREKRRRAILQLLAIERAETDSMLSTERSIADSMVAARDDMLGAVTHDLRGRLNTVLLKAATLIDRHPNDQQLVRDADVMQRTAAQMSTLIDDLLDVASMEGGRVRVDRVAADVVAIVADEVETHHAAAEARGVRLSIDARERSIIAHVDPSRISRVLMNILGNALKFTPAGGCISVRVARDREHVEISVADTGRGIAADQLDSVFERFRQIGSESRRSGYGLGLYIARAIVAAHDGRIWVESTEGEGSTFHVRLPLEGATRRLDVHHAHGH